MLSATLSGDSKAAIWALNLVLRSLALPIAPSCMSSVVLVYLDGLLLCCRSAVLSILREHFEHAMLLLRCGLSTVGRVSIEDEISL